MSLSALARARGFARLAGALETRPLPAPTAQAPAQPDLGDQGDDFVATLGRMMRRGLEPACVVALLDAFAERPLERALVAWDALAGSLVGEDGYLERLRREARLARELLPPPGEQGIARGQAPLPTLLQRGPLVADAETLADRADEHDLAAVEALRLHGGPLADALREPARLEGARSFGRLVHLAGLPTLASLHLQHLHDAFGHAPALDDLCEALLDAGAPSRLPPLPPADQAGYRQPLVEYVTYRSAIASGRAGAAHLGMKAARALREQMADPLTAHPLLRAVEADLGTRFGDDVVPLDALDALCAERPLWRYAQEVRCTAICVRGRADAPERLAEYVASFGGAAELWRQALAAGVRGAAALLARELTDRPWDLAAWQGAAHHTGDAAALDEVRARLRAQSTL